MRVIRETLMGQHIHWKIALSRTEVETMRRAGDIASRMRDLLPKDANGDAISDVDTDLAFIEHGCSHLVADKGCTL